MAIDELKQFLKAFGEKSAQFYTQYKTIDKPLSAR